MVASISRPGYPYDNASCESFMKTLKREEICARDYRDLEHLLESVEGFIELQPMPFAFGSGLFWLGYLTLSEKQMPQVVGNSENQNREWARWKQVRCLQSRCSAN
jgi:integrase-like protein